MKKLFFTTLLVCFGLLAKAEYNVTSVIYDGNGQQCNYWINNGNEPSETLREMDMPYDGGVSGISKYLEMTRVQNDEWGWHGICFDLSGLYTKFTDGNQLAMWVKKDIAENVQVEFKFTDGTNVNSGFAWVDPSEGWKYIVFNLWELGDEYQEKEIQEMYVKTHTGGSDGQVATVQVTGIVKGFDLNDLPVPSAINETEALSISTSDGRISCEGEFTVYDLAGRDVTAQNGNLKGVYVVICGDNAAKVVVD